MKKILALDFGEKRVGIAITDSTGQIAKPYGILPNISFSFLAREIKEICKKEKVAQIIIGLPLTLRGGLEKQAQETKKFSKRLAQEISLPILLQDERFTSKEANRILKEMGIRQKKNKVDTIAALLILQNYLEKQ